MLPQHTHHLLARRSERSLDRAHLHGADEHARQPERHGLRKLVAPHRHLEAVAKIDVQDLPREAVQHQVRRMPISEPEDVADHAHHGERAREVAPSLEPRLGRGRLHPQHAVQVHPLRGGDDVLEGLGLVHERERVEVRREMEHQPVLDVEQNATRQPVVADQRVQRVALRDPFDKPRIRRKRDDSVSLDSQIQSRTLIRRRQERVD
mmetsp:Transcript_31785/g.69550  ORF Transcript_31785/g.69550 Transcript_31785/m.69550 type:complete len:207 (-) Transcript_31785:165-785(-)